MADAELPAKPDRLLRRLIPYGQNYKVTPWGLGWRSNTLFIVVVVGTGIFSDIFLYGLIVSIIPFVLRDRLGVAPEHLQNLSSFLISIYAFATMIASPIAGFFADKFASSRQAPFLLGLMALTASTVLLALADSVALIAIARCLQGASAAVVWTVGMAICLETVGHKNMGKTMGSIFAFVTAATMFAPALGGILYEKTGYKGVFGVALGVLIIDLILRCLVIEKKVAKKYFDADPALSAGSSTPSSTSNGTSTVVADEETLLVPKAPNAAYELPPPSSKIIQTMPALACLRNKALLVACVINFVQAFLFSSCDATLPLIAIEWYDFSPLRAGLLFFPIVGADVIVGPLTGWAVDRFGTKVIAVVGFCMTTVGYLLLRIPRPGGTDQIILFCAIFALCASGISTAGTPAIVEVGVIMERYYEANPDRFGEHGPFAQLYGITSTFFSLGLTLGPLVAGYLKDTIGFGNMNTVLAGISLVMIGLTAKYTGDPLPRWKNLGSRGEEEQCEE